MSNLDYNRTQPPSGARPADRSIMVPFVTDLTDFDMGATHRPPVAEGHYHRSLGQRPRGQEFHAVLWLKAKLTRLATDEFGLQAFSQ